MQRARIASPGWIVLMSLATSAPAAAAPRPEAFMGLQAIAKFDEARHVGSWAGTRARGVALHRDLGVQFSREGFVWHQLEPQPGHYDFADLDDAARACRQAGVAIQWMVVGTPHWASTAPLKRRNEPASYQNAPPMGLYEPICADGTDVPRPGSALNPRQLWGRMLARAAARYPGCDWQIGNEPDFPAGNPGADFSDPSRSFAGSSADYARMLVVAHRVIHSVDPSARVLTGGLGHPDYLRALLAAGAGPAIDVLDFHVYGGPDSDGALRAFLALSSRMAAVMRHAGLRRPLRCSETGFPASDPQGQASYIPKLYATARAMGLEGIAYYCTTNPSWKQMGLIDWHTLSRPTAGYAAYRTTARALAGTRFASKIPTDPRVVAYRFVGPERDRTVIVAWAPFVAAAHPVRVHFEFAGGRVVSPDGQARRVGRDPEVALSQIPVLLDTHPRPYRPQPAAPLLSLGRRALVAVSASAEDPTGFHGPELAVDGDPDSEWVGAAGSTLTLQVTPGPPIRALQLKTGPLAPCLAIEVWEAGTWQRRAQGWGSHDWSTQVVALSAPYAGTRLRLVFEKTTGAPVSVFDLQTR